ncbi:MAG: hypothetical protein MJ191_05685 [Clostridium sp.]|nr:hypothetical protein [Clostridium sp.]
MLLETVKVYALEKTSDKSGKSYYVLEIDDKDGNKIKDLLLSYLEYKAIINLDKE